MRSPFKNHTEFGAVSPKMSEQNLFRAPTEWRFKKNYHATPQRKEDLLLSGRATGPLFLIIL
jgi:hypothetical protein